MSAHMKKHLTNETLRLKDSQGDLYILPKKIASKYKVKIESKTSIAAKDFFEPYEKKYTKPGLLLRGLRIREGLTQEKFAKKIKLTQANLSHMENGRRTIGRIIAKRIQKAFHVDYKIFLE